MDKQPVGQLPDLTQSNNDDEIMVITNDEYNQLKKEKISDFITDLTSTDENNAIVKGTDGKLFTKDFGNASNITEGTLPVSVLPDIPKNKLPEIETDDLPDSGITAGTYTYPTDIVINSKGQVTSITEGQAGANNANQDLSNLGPLGLDKINQSKALETGSVSSDADVYADVLKYAHSTFDLSKFTVIGSPTITEDGIASNFTNSNYAETIPVSKISLNTFMITCDFKWIENQGTIFSSARGGSTEYGIALIINDNKLGFYSSSNGTGWNVANFKTGSTSLVSKNIYKVSVIFTGTQYICMLLNKNTGALTTEFTVDSTDKVFAGLNMINFGGHSYWQPLNGSIDLKSIAIWADGVPVFNGNKTGLYVAKPDNYIVEGSPTITDDGILTNCPSQNDYLSATIPSLSQFEKVRIEFELKVKEVPSSTCGIFNIPNDENPMTANSGTYAWLNSVGFNINLAYNGADNGTGSTAKYPIAIGDFIKVIAEGNKNSVGSIKVSKNNGVFNDLTLTQSNACNFQEATKLFLGITGVDRQMQSSAEFDINSFKIYGDGNLIYQPCLKIPYTKSKTGSKIVDAAYRDRVQDMYEQYGYAPYYTIDEENENFTLPMGEIYGMIERKNNELNNPFSLFDYKYADAPIYNMSWLQANGSWYAKSVYISAYEALVVENNSDITAGTTTTLPSGGSYTKRGLSVKLSTDSYTDTDFVINTTDETFRLPLKNGQEGMFAGQAVVGNGLTLGLSDNSINYGLTDLNYHAGVTDGGTLLAAIAYYGLPAGSPGGLSPSGPSAVTLGVTKAPDKSGLVVAGVVPDGWSLYYYVGETVQNANLIDAGRIAENFATKQYATGASFPSDRSIDLTVGASGSTYTAPADGYFLLNKNGINGQYVVVVNAVNHVGFRTIVADNTNTGAWTMAKKGEQVIIYYNCSGEINFWRFIYATGLQGGS